MIDLLRQRRSIRKYKATPIDAEKLDIIKEALLRSPTSRNRNPWSFFVVDDKRQIEKLSLAKEHGSAFLSNAPLAIVVGADEDISDVWIEDCSIAAIIAQLTAQSLGLGSCWIQIRSRFTKQGDSSEEYIKCVMGLKKDFRILSIISFGYSDEEKSPIPIDSLDYSKML